MGIYKQKSGFWDLESLFEVHLFAPDLEASLGFLTVTGIGIEEAE